MVIHSAWALVLVSLGAAFLPSLSIRLRLPSVVLEILFGVLIGKSLLNLQFGGQWLSFLAHLGFLILMFHAGMEINFKMLGAQPAGMFAIQVAVFGLTVLLSMVAAFFLGQGFYLGLVLSTTSLGLVVPTLKDTGAIQSMLGQNAMIAATLADFLTLFAITFFLVWHQNGFGWEFLRPLPLFIGFGIVLKLVRFLAWWYPEKVGRLLSDRDTQELGVRFSLALAIFIRGPVRARPSGTGPGCLSGRRVAVHCFPGKIAIGAEAIRFRIWLSGTAFFHSCGHAVRRCQCFFLGATCFYFQAFNPRHGSQNTPLPAFCCCRLVHV